MDQPRTLRQPFLFAGRPGLPRPLLANNSPAHLPLSAGPFTQRGRGEIGSISSECARGIGHEATGFRTAAQSLQRRLLLVGMPKSQLRSPGTQIVARLLLPAQTWPRSGGARRHAFQTETPLPRRWLCMHVSAKMGERRGTQTVRRRLKRECILRAQELPNRGLRYSFQMPWPDVCPECGVHRVKHLQARGASRVACIEGVRKPMPRSLDGAGAVQQKQRQNTCRGLVTRRQLPTSPLRGRKSTARPGLLQPAGVEAKEGSALSVCARPRIRILSWSTKEMLSQWPETYESRE